MTPPAMELLTDLRRLPGHPGAFFGAGAGRRLALVVRQHGARRVLMIHGSRSLERSGMADVVEGMSRWATLRFITSMPNPTAALVRSGVDVAREFAPDTVIGIGGGSTLDLAKAVAVLAAQPGEPLDAVGRTALRPRDASLVLVPTTAGSGSELTAFATLYQDGRKLSLDAEVVRSDLSLVDPQLSRHAPASVAAAAGADALCQAAESYWAVTASPESRAIAWTAYDSAVAALHRCMADGAWADPACAADRAWAASLAGAAINITRTTAAHAFSYALTTRLGIPHGVAVALHLRWLLRHNAGVTEDDCRRGDGAASVAADVARLQDRAQALTGAPVQRLLGRLAGASGSAAHLGGLALAPDAWRAEWEAAAASSRALNNPRIVTAGDVAHAVRKGDSDAD